MRKLIHAVSGPAALALVSVFWLSTTASELLGSEATVATVKTAILFGLPVMVLLMAAAGGSGLSMAGRAAAGKIAAKRRRMPFIALNGLLVLIPCALLLRWRAVAGQFDATFYVVQAIELAAGAVNITLLSLNMRDGVAMVRGRKLAKRPGRPGANARGAHQEP